MELLDPSRTLLQNLIDERTNFITAKTNFTQQFRELSQYFFQVRLEESQYNDHLLQGQALNDGSINDNIGARAAKGMASAVLGATWKNESGTFRIVPSKRIKITPAVKEYFGRLNSDLTHFMERKKGRLEESLMTAVLELIIFGTTGVVTQQGDYNTPLRYHQKSVLNFCLGYDGNGDVNTIFIDYSFSAQELYSLYGARAGSSVMQAYNSKDMMKRFTVTEAIKPRRSAKALIGKLAMPFATYAFMPYENIFLEEGGYESLPMAIAFCTKLEWEAYGRSFGMDALPTVRQSNQAAEILAVGGEATALPPLGMYDNGSLAGKAVDLTAAALNVFNVAGTVPSDKPIFPLYNVGDLRVMFEWWKVLHENVASYFSLDRLFGLDNTQRKTLGEANLWDSIRKDSLSGIFTIVMRFYEQIIERSVLILEKMGLAGVVDPENLEAPEVIELLKNGYSPYRIPEEVLAVKEAKGEWYDIQFISPAATSMKSDELRATMLFSQVMTQMGSISPEFMFILDPIGTADKLKDLLSADIITMRTPDQIQSMVENYQKQQAQAAQMELKATNAKAEQSLGQAQASKAGAMRTMIGTAQGNTGGADNGY